MNKVQAIADLDLDYLIKNTVGFYGIPSNGVDLFDIYGEDRYGKQGWPKNALALCTDINADGYFVVDDFCWLCFTPIIHKDNLNLKGSKISIIKNLHGVSVD